jgi:hypothetical protein
VLYPTYPGYETHLGRAWVPVGCSTESAGLAGVLLGRRRSDIVETRGTSFLLGSLCRMVWYWFVPLVASGARSTLCMLALGRIFHPYRISLVCRVSLLEHEDSTYVVEAFPRGRYFLKVVRSSDEEVRSRRAHFMGRCDRSKSHLPYDNLFTTESSKRYALPHGKLPQHRPNSIERPHEASSELEATTKHAVSSMTDIYENTTRVYYALHEQMNEFYRKGATDIKSTREAESIAHSLIKNDDLPLLIRCRALCILGCSDRGDYLFHAEESVRYAKLGLASDKVGDHKGDEDAQLISEMLQRVS